MALYGITAVRLDGERVVQVRMKRFDGATKSLVGELGNYEAHEAANLIAGGDTIYSIFKIPGGTVLGPKFKYVVYAGGNEGVELEAGPKDRRVQDLDTF